MASVGCQLTGESQSTCGHCLKLDKSEKSCRGKGGTLQEKTDSEMRPFSLSNSQSTNWAPVVEIRPLSSVPCVYFTCIKEAFISLEQIINTFHQRCEGGGLALGGKNHIIIKSCPKHELKKN